MPKSSRQPKPLARPFLAAVSDAQRAWCRSFEEDTNRWYEPPAKRPAREDDALALTDIVHCQCFGNAKRVRETIEELFTAAGGKLPGASIHERYLSLIAWYDQGCPLRFRPLSRRKRKDYRALILLNALAATERLSRRAS